MLCESMRLTNSNGTFRTRRLHSIQQARHPRFNNHRVRQWTYHDIASEQPLMRNRASPKLFPAKSQASPLPILERLCSKMVQASFVYKR